MHLRFALSFISATVLVASEPQNHHTLLQIKLETTIGIQEIDHEPFTVTKIESLYFSY